MSNGFDDLKILQDAEKIGDAVWSLVSGWDYFAQKTVGQQLVRSVDSIGANIAESFGRYHYGERLQFLYYARGSLYETKFWLNRCQTRNLIEAEIITEHLATLATLSVQLNKFIRSIKNRKSNRNQLKEQSAIYTIKQFPMSEANKLREQSEQLPRAKRVNHEPRRI